MIGSEGAYGILVSVTLKIFRHMPRNTRRFSYMFRSFEDGVNAVKEIMQSENGRPSVCRLSDPEETDVALKLYGVDSPLVNLPFSLLGMERGKRCLFLGSADGGRRYTRMVKGNVRKICLRRGGMPLSGYVTRKWEHGRFRDPYLREDLQDYGIVIDTLECAVNWENLYHVRGHVRDYIKSRENTSCMTHMSHCYPQGANLYFIFINMFESAEDFSAFHAGILEAIHTSGAALSHHHGIGKLFAPWLERNLGSESYTILRALKEHFDPGNIMNPGGTLGFD
ncbi:MAG: FAD-binding oxidoreductase [bacterium]